MGTDHDTWMEVLVGEVVLTFLTADEGTREESKLTSDESNKYKRDTHHLQECEQ